MLIEKSVKANDIVTFKLVSGEEIVGKLISLNIESGVLKVNKPIVVAMQMVGPQQASLGFLPFMAAANDDATLVFQPHAYLTTPVVARQDVATGYTNATSSLAIPPKQGLILGS